MAKGIIINIESTANTQTKKGGYIARLSCGAGKKELVGSSSQTTVNREALSGIIAALESLNEKAAGQTIEIKTSNAYVYQTVKYGHLKMYITNNWTTYSGVPAKNRDLWEELLQLKKEKDVKVAFTLEEDKDLRRQIKLLMKSEPSIEF